MNSFSVREILNIKEPADRVHMSISSDGKWLAFCLYEKKQSKKTLGVSQAVEGNSQWVCNLLTGDSFPVAENAISSWGGVWSPNGTTLAFYADINGYAQLYLWTPNGGSLKLASDIIVRPFFGFEKPIWLDDNQHIIIKSNPLEKVDDSYFNGTGLIEEERVTNHNLKPKVYSTNNEYKKNYTEPNNWWINRYTADLTIIDILTGDCRSLCKNCRPVGMAISNNGKYLAFTNCLGEERLNTQQNIFELWVCSLDDLNKKPKLIESNIRMGYGLSFSWGIDNDSIFYTTDGPLSEGGLWFTSVSSPHSAKLLFSEEGLNLGREYDGPMILPSSDILTIVNGSLWLFSNKIVKKKISLKEREIVAVFPSYHQFEKYVIVQTMEKKNSLYGFFKIDYEAGEIEELLEEPKCHLPWFEGGAVYKKNYNYEVIAYFSQSANEAPFINLFDIRAKKIISSTVFNSSKSDELGEVQLITWKQCNKNLRGALLLPKNKNGKLPVIMRVYGGSMQSNYARFFGMSMNRADNHQLFTTKGFAVFLPDLPMERNNEPADAITKAIENSLDALVSHPDIDPERIGIIGHSFGGYTALISITRLQRFKAAVISAGISNLISFYTKFDPYNPNYGWVEDGQANMAATLWENKERYIRNSPLFDFDKIQTPVLIIQGAKDELCKDEAGPIYASLSRLGKTAELVLYDEGHWQGTWSDGNIEDYYNRVLNWFNKYV